MAKDEDRRRTRLVDRRFQFGLALRLLAVMSVLFIAGLLMVFAPSAYVLATTQDLSRLEPAAEEFLVLHERIWPAAILSFCGLFIYVLVFSHRIAGPVFRIDAVLRQMLRDEYPVAVRFRRKDFFQPTAELLDELCRKLSGRSAQR